MNEESLPSSLRVNVLDLIYVRNLLGSTCSTE